MTITMNKLTQTPIFTKPFCIIHARPPPTAADVTVPSADVIAPIPTEPTTGDVSVVN
ncbi:hypothetical protein HanIR_Chr02g0089261 [Helianthus annuus]|nr:hypothetical protein HanIR_Chr02g0089261 [Helianthus annuus]